MKTLTAHELRRMILDDEEIALLDAREEGAFHDSHLFDAPVRVLEGGNAAWVATGYSLTTTESRFLDDDIDDVLVRIHEAEGGMEKAMNDYLEWEIGLVGDVVLDGAAAWQRMEEGGGR